MIQQPQPQPQQQPQMDQTKYLQLKQAFVTRDRDGSNQLDPGELAAVMADCGMPADPNSLAQTVGQYDMDGNGRISFQEFMSIFHPAPTPPKPHVVPAVAADGKFVDQQFPPNNNSIFASPNPAADHVSDVQSHAGPGQVRWIRAGQLCAGGKLFNNIHPNDIAQGVLGDCWFLAALAGLAEFEGAVFHLFQEKTVQPDGKYTLNIFNAKNKAWEAVVIDDFIPLGPDGQPLMAKPQDNEMWVLLAEKAFAKWFGSYVQIQGAYCLVAYMLLADCSLTRAYSQGQGGRPPFNPDVYQPMDVTLQNPKDRNSVGLAPAGGPVRADQVWGELVQADQQNFIMCAWTMKDPPGGAAGVGASGEAIAADGIVKGHAYSVITAREVQCDGRVWRVLQVRNPWGANPAAEWKGQLCDAWPQWPQFPELRQALEIGNAELDGMFWMTWDDFRNRFSDVGVVPKQMAVPKLGSVEGMVQGSTNQKHDKKFKSAANAGAQPQPMAPQVQPQPMPQYQPQMIEAPQYVQPSRTVYAAAPQYAAQPQYAAAPQYAAPMTYAAPATYASPASYAAPTYAAPATYAAPTASVIRY